MSVESTATVECHKCGASRPASEFYPSEVRRRTWRCPTCMGQKSKSWIHRNRERSNEAERKRIHARGPEYNRAKYAKNDRRSHLQRKYRITQEQYDSILAAQGGRCAVCGSKPDPRGRKFSVDHCHSSNQVRGILCHKCNSAIGMLGDDPRIAARAAEYLAQKGMALWASGPKPT